MKATATLTAVILIILASGCLDLQSEDVEEKPVKNEKLILDDCLNKTEGTRDTCLYRLAEARNTEAACNQINSTYLRDECYRQLARRTLNTKTCLPISDTNRIVYCIATVSSDKDICERLGEPAKSSCKAYVTGNPGVCAEILDAQQRTGCQVQASLGSNTANGCKLIEEIVERDACLMQTAIQGKSTDLCALVEDSGRRHRCRTEVELKKQL